MVATVAVWSVVHWLPWWSERWLMYSMFLVCWPACVAAEWCCIYSMNSMYSMRRVDCGWANALNATINGFYHDSTVLGLMKEATPAIIAPVCATVVHRVMFRPYTYLKKTRYFNHNCLSIICEMFTNHCFSLLERLLWSCGSYDSSGLVIKLKLPNDVDLVGCSVVCSTCFCTRLFWLFRSKLA